MADPAIIPSFERELEDAKTRADTDAIADVTKRYEAERRKRAKADETGTTDKNGGDGKDKK